MNSHGGSISSINVCVCMRSHTCAIAHTIAVWSRVVFTMSLSILTQMELE